MTKKKRFGISEALTRGLTETIHVVENNAGIYRNVMLPLSRIELDPENPRKLAVDLADIRTGLRSEDPLYQRKSEELERLKELAHTIKANGIINPVVVYKRGELYRIVAGERRCLASILVGKQEIEARVFNEKPKAFDLKLIQWVENTAREDLTLEERLGNVQDILREYEKQDGAEEVTATVLKNITGLSLSQTSYYLAVLNAPEDVRDVIRAGQIKNLDKAALIAGIEKVTVRQAALAACVSGASLKELRTLINEDRQLKKVKAELQSSHRGRITAKINMGTTVKTDVVKTIIDAVVSHDDYERHKDIFSHINWADLRQVTKAFRKLIEILELEMAR